VLEIDASEDALTQMRRRIDPRQYRMDIRQAPLLRVFIAEDKVQQRWVATLEHPAKQRSTPLSQDSLPLASLFMRRSNLVRLRQ
jgi:hypothetical protein